ncbi:dTMP kinase [Endozoicomonas sp. (ex Bugula neritina AB1)]|nr:dTMP kinase [Endozoicomonas sp. (ex Bugula neritina AB1)]
MGFFLTIEGGEGAGKTTALACVREWLQDLGRDFEETREPGGTRLAEEVRGLLLAEHEETVSDITELLLVFAARSQNFSENIEPALQAGKVVICDRFTDASYAYQGGGRGIETQKIAVLEQLVQGNRRPDMTLLLDVDPVVGMERARGRGKLDRIELENIDFFHRVRATYLQRAEQYPQQYVTIDASQSIESVKEQIQKALTERLKEKG